LLIKFALSCIISSAGGVLFHSRPGPPRSSSFSRSTFRGRGVVGDQVQPKRSVSHQVKLQEEELVKYFTLKDNFNEECVKLKLITRSLFKQKATN
jgi:hypothetical protein